jgi:4-amino-4-deoxy-L-arabinose transferase-like glycosyltransferase
VLAAALAVVPFVVVARRHLGRAGLTVATALLVTSPMLFSEAHTGYGWGQARLWMLSAMAALALTIDRGRLRHAVLLGVFCALCSLISGLAVFVPPLAFAVLALVLMRRCRWSGWRRSVVGWAGVLLIAAVAVYLVGAQLPASLMPDGRSLVDDLRNTLWKTSLGPLIAHYQGPEWFYEHIRVSQKPIEFASTLGLLTVRSVLAPMTFMGTSHYVIGHVMDPVGGGLALVGMIASLLSRSLRRRSALVWVFFVPSLIVAGVLSPYHEYGDLRVTRLYLLVPFWAIFAGLGFELVARVARVHLAPASNRVRLAGCAMVVMLIALWNLYAIAVRAPRQEGYQGPALAMKVRQQSPPDTEVLACFDVWFPLGPFLWAYSDQPRLRVVSEAELEETMVAGGSAGGPVYLFRVGMRDPGRRQLCRDLLTHHSDRLSCLAMPDDRAAQVLRCQRSGSIMNDSDVPWRSGAESAHQCDRVGPW